MLLVEYYDIVYMFLKILYIKKSAIWSDMTSKILYKIGFKWVNIDFLFRRKKRVNLTALMSNRSIADRKFNKTEKNKRKQHV